jgi:hypothetical protein
MIEVHTNNIGLDPPLKPIKKRIFWPQTFKTDPGQATTPKYQLGISLTRSKTFLKN